MFTGIIQSVGSVKEMKSTSPESFTLTLEAAFDGVDQDPVALGESIAVNGVCLTVTSITALGASEQYTFDLAPETVHRTSLSKLAAGRKVNLERSLRMGDRLSGHWVQGHVDGVAVLKKTTALPGDCFELAFEMQDASLLKYTVKKGSISIEGISLTIHDIQQNQFMFQIIPHTWKETNLSDLLLGEKVNIEVDILAKYIERLYEPKA